LLIDDMLRMQMKSNALKSAYRYHHPQLMQQLVALFKKKNALFKERRQWRIVKERNFLEFRHLFQKQWLNIIAAGKRQYDNYGQMTKFRPPRAHFTDRQRMRTFKYLSGQ